MFDGVFGGVWGVFWKFFGLILKGVEVDFSLNLRLTFVREVDMRAFQMLRSRSRPHSRMPVAYRIDLQKHGKN